MKIISDISRGLLLPACAVALLMLQGCAAVEMQQSNSTIRARSPNAEPAKKEAPPTPAQSMRSGEQAERTGDLNHALINYVDAAMAEPRNAEAHYRVARVQDALGNSVTAREAYERAIALNPVHAGALEGLGLMLMEQGNQDRASRLLRQALEREPRRWRACNGLGVLADLKGDHVLAQSYFNRGLKSEPQRPELLNNLGYSLYLAGNLPAARQHFERALSAAPAYSTAWSNLALVRVRMGDSAGAVDAFSELLKPYQAYNNVGYLLYVKGDMAQARKYLEKAIALSPTYYAQAEENLTRVASATRGR